MFYIYISGPSSLHNSFAVSIILTYKFAFLSGDGLLSQNGGFSNFIAYASWSTCIASHEFVIRFFKIMGFCETRYSETMECPRHKDEVIGPCNMFND
jgi:hypothetical protein